MSQPQRWDAILRGWWASEVHKRGAAQLKREASSDSVSVMTTNENDFRIAQLVVGIIEDSADDANVLETNAKDAAKVYVQAVLDNGWISSMDDTPVWELVDLLGYDPRNYDPFVVMAQVGPMIDECELFND